MRKLILLLIISTSIQAQNNAAFWLSDEELSDIPISDNGLVAYYNASIKLSYDPLVSTTTWFDLTLNSYDLTIEGCAFSECNLGYFSFDGVNDYMSHNTAILDDAVSVSIWFRAASITSNVLLDFENFSSGSGLKQEYWIGEVSNVNTGEEFTIITENPTDEVYSSYNLAPDIWYNITTVRNAENNFNIYIYDTQGNLSESTVYPSQFNPLTDLPYFFHGDIGELAIYDIALTGEEIINNYNATKTRYSSYCEDGLILYYDFDDPSSYNAGELLVYDKTIYNNDGSFSVLPSYNESDGGGSVYLLNTNLTNTNIINDNIRTIMYWFRPVTSYTATTPGKGLSFSANSIAEHWFGDGNTGIDETFTIFVTPPLTFSRYKYITSAPFSTSSWHHIAVSYNSSTSRYDVYINGVLTEMIYAGSTPTTDYLIQQFKFTNPVSIDLRLNELKVYNISLTGQQILDYYNESKTSKVVINP